MSDFAIVTGQIFADYGVASERVPARGVVRFTPLELDERVAVVEDRIRYATTDAAGRIILDGGPVELWAGRWKVTLPDGEVLEDVRLEAGRTYDLVELRGFVPEPGQIVQTVKLDGVRAVALPAGVEPTATVEAGGLVLGIPKGERGADGAPGKDGVDGKDGEPGKNAPDVEDTGWVDLFATGGATLAGDQWYASETRLWARRVGAMVQLRGVTMLAGIVDDPSSVIAPFNQLATITDERFLPKAIDGLPGDAFQQADLSTRGLQIFLLIDGGVLILAVTSPAGPLTRGEVPQVPLTATYLAGGEGA